MKSVYFVLFLCLLCTIPVACVVSRQAEERLAATPSQSEQMIPRTVLFGNPDKASVRLSHDGAHIAYLAPKNGVLNIYVALMDDLAQAKAITDDQLRGIRHYFWSYDHQHIFYLQDVGGDENWQLHKVHVATQQDTNLTPEPGVRTQLYKVGSRFPHKIIIGTNARNKSYFDLFELDVTTNEQRLIFQNDAYEGFTFDEDYNLRFLTKFNEEGGLDIYQYQEDATTLFLSVPKEDIATTDLVGFDKTGQVLYMTESLTTNTAQLVALQLDTGEKRVLFHNAKADIADLHIKPVENTVQAVASCFLRKEWQLLDDAVQADFAYLTSLERGELEIVSQTLDDQHWVVAYLLDNGPVSYYYYHRADKKARKLFTNRPVLEQYTLAPMHDVVIPSRDGLELVSYLTLPPIAVAAPADTTPKQPVPMILLVHGGPSARDEWGYNSLHQWLANRGYAVLSVNYRGSIGFGKRFFQAGYGEWAAKMHDDLLDAVDWAVAQQITTREQVGIMGGSYGGYATLVGLTFTPDVFACGVDIVGMSNLITDFESMPPYWKPATSFLINLTGGDPSTEAGRALLRSKSPLTFVDNIKKPLLIGHGANDPRVKQAESDQIVQAMQAKQIPVTYVLYPDEGHGFARSPNRLSFYAITEGFLAKFLGGKVEPIGNSFQDASLRIMAGEAFVQGLQEDDR